MIGFQEKKRFKRILYSRMIIGVLIVMLFFAVSATRGVFEKYRDTRIKKEAVLTRLRELETHRNAISKEANRLETEHGVEQELREKYNVAKEGEGVIVILDPHNIEEENRAEKNKVSNFFGNIFQGIKNIFTP